MRHSVILAAFFVSILRAAVPDNDSRQSEVNNYKTHFSMREYTSLEKWKSRKQQLRNQILSAAGLLPMPARPAIHADVVRRVIYANYSIEAVLIETLPGYYLGANLYRPTHRTSAS